MTQPAKTTPWPAKSRKCVRACVNVWLSTWVGLCNLRDVFQDVPWRGCCGSSFTWSYHRWSYDIVFPSINLYNFRTENTRGDPSMRISRAIVYHRTRYFPTKIHRKWKHTQTNQWLKPNSAPKTIVLSLSDIFRLITFLALSRQKQQIAVWRQSIFLVFSSFYSFYKLLPRETK